VAANGATRHPEAAAALGTPPAQPTPAIRRGEGKRGVAVRGHDPLRQY